MGGAAVTLGNVTPAAEFNFFVDPHAANIVFQSGVPITMLGLDVTHQVLATKERRDMFLHSRGRTTSIVADLMEFYCQFDIVRYGMDGGPLHDPCVIAYMLDQAIFTTRPVHVAIETQSSLTRGASVADWWGVTNKPPNCLVAEIADDQLFFDLLLERLSKLP